MIPNPSQKKTGPSKPRTLCSKGGRLWRQHAVGEVDEEGGQRGEEKG